MRKNKILDNYLTYLHEQTAEIALFVLIMVAQALLYLLLFIGASVGSSKTDKKLSKKIYEITGKKFDVRIIKGDQPGAFCFGGFTKHIFITSGLISIMNEREVIAVCLHESSHIITYDSIKTLVARMASVSVPALLITNLSEYIYKHKKSSYSNIMLLAILLSLIMIFLPSILIGKYNELKSDKYTVQFGYGRDLMSALEKLEEWVLKNRVKDSKIKMFFHKIQHFYDVHPPIKKRVDKLLNSVELYESLAKNDKTSIKKIIDKTILEKNDNW